MDYNSPFAGRTPDDFFWGMPDNDTTQPTEEIPPPHERDIGAPRIIEMPAPRIRNMPEPYDEEVPDMPWMPNSGDWRMEQMPDNAMPKIHTPQVLDQIRNVLAAKADDIALYQSLISKAPTAEEKKILSGIRDDTKKHIEILRQLYRDLSGSMPPPTQRRPIRQPASYCGGLKKALLGKQAMQSQRDILPALTDMRQINLFNEIITDELRHLALFNYLYAKNRCSN